MSTIKYIPIETERLTLRKATESDWEIISYLRSDKVVNQFVKRKSAETKDLVLEFLARIDQGIKAETLYYWAITAKPDPTMIGSISLWNFSTDGKKAEVGYDLSPAFHKKGIMAEALKRVIKFGFDTLKFEVIEAYTQSNNKNSIQLLTKQGFELLPDKKDEDNLMNLVFEIKKSE
ncbi:N-acetyltransferase [Putridiphycobacter roseus]|uniref:N-acetyltransferase n=1 Tax=Putridiphycobacter roseus TaxID=2219161 RepID=A0A2W1NMX9_9FLAO|nr:GNAT family N-acetyltransferase [Putridiphycobacter roseus]PZE15958.1 N-acetyltransferase [Putridiphycobacter roseus]